MGKLDRVLDRLQSRPNEEALRGKAEELLASLRDEYHPDAAEQLLPVLEQIQQVQLTTAQAIDAALGNVARSLNDLRQLDNIGGQVDDVLSKALAAKFEPFADRIIEILKAHRDAGEGDEAAEHEQWRFRVQRDSEGKILEVIAVRQTDLDAELMSLDDALH